MIFIFQVNYVHSGIWVGRCQEISISKLLLVVDYIDWVGVGDAKSRPTDISSYPPLLDYSTALHVIILEHTVLGCPNSDCMYLAQYSRGT